MPVGEFDEPGGGGPALVVLVRTGRDEPGELGVQGAYGAKVLFLVHDPVEDAVSGLVTDGRGPPAFRCR
ncbi:hypothetical protein [Streptomyces albogriseolus]|uniref:hypothetical protein n=1 Tax=Streptomyces albogriseolus TaxID=1887 RepID=UPI00345F98C4